MAGIRDAINAANIGDHRLPIERLRLQAHRE